MADQPAISAKQIAAFRAVMEAGSITGAAELLYITQPAVSRLIHDLISSLRHSIGGQSQWTLSLPQKEGIKC